MLSDHRLVQHHQSNDRVNRPEKRGQDPPDRVAELQNRELCPGHPLGRRHGRIDQGVQQRLGHQEKQEQAHHFQGQRGPGIPVGKLQGTGPPLDERDPGQKKENAQHEAEKCPNVGERPEFFRYQKRDAGVILHARRGWRQFQQGRLKLHHHDTPERPGQPEPPENHVQNAEHLDPFGLQNRLFRRKIAHETI